MFRSKGTVIVVCIIMLLVMFNVGCMEEKHGDGSVSFYDLIKDLVVSLYE